MLYLQLIKLRRSLVAFAFLLASIEGLFLASVLHGAAVGRVARYDASDIFGACGYLVIAFAALLAAQSSRWDEAHAIRWTKPMSRVRQALMMYLVDSFSIILVSLAVDALTLIVLAIGHAAVTNMFSQHSLAVAGLTAGVGTMLYGIVAMITPWRRIDSVRVAAVVVFSSLVLAILQTADRLGALWRFAMFANFANPLQYLNSIVLAQGLGNRAEDAAAVPLQHIVAAAETTWALAILLLVFGVVGWNRFRI